MNITKSTKIFKGNISSFVIMHVQVNKMRKKVLSMIQRADELNAKIDECLF